MEEIICEKCGIPSQPGTRFCQQCGSSLTSASANIGTNPSQGSDQSLQGEDLVVPEGQLQFWDPSQFQETKKQPPEQLPQPKIAQPTYKPPIPSPPIYKPKADPEIRGPKDVLAGLVGGVIFTLVGVWGLVEGPNYEVINGPDSLIPIASVFSLGLGLVWLWKVIVWLLNYFAVKE